MANENRENRLVHLGFRVPRSVKQRLTELASAEYRTMSSLCGAVLVEYLERTGKSTALNGSGHKVASERINSRGVPYRLNK